MRSVVTVASGTAGAQLITVICSPLVTRLYGPDAFGVLGSYLAVVTLVAPLAALAYPNAIVLPKSERDALGLVKLALLLSMITFLMLTLFFWLGGAQIAELLGIQALDSYLLMIPLAVLFISWVEVVQQWLIRQRKFAVLARNVVIQSFLVNVSKVGLGFYSPVAGVLIALGTFAYLVHAMLLLLGCRSADKLRSEHKQQEVSVTLFALAKRHSDFPLYRAPQNFINAVSQGLPVLMLTALFSPAVAGFYTLSKMVMGMPSALIGKAVSDVFYPKINELAQKGENLSSYILRATLALFGIAAIPFGFVFLFGPTIFEWVFGREWGAAGEYARWLALFFLFNFINKPCVASVPVLGIQRGLLLYEIFSTGVKVVGLLIGFYWFESDLWAVALFCIFGVFAYAAMMIWIVSCAKRQAGYVKTG